jgi:hypothetical protein
MEGWGCSILPTAGMGVLIRMEMSFYTNGRQRNYVKKKLTTQEDEK